MSNKDKPVSVKIFNNGSIHFTGCIAVENMVEAVYKLCIECRRKVAIIDKTGKIRDIVFAKNREILKVENLYGGKTDMINCITDVPFKIDRPKLRVLMKNDGYNVVYDSNGHAGVKISGHGLGEKITIFVFESGSVIIILGRQGFKNVTDTYTFIYKYLLQNYDSIIKDDMLIKSVIECYMSKYKI